MQEVQDALEALRRPMLLKLDELQYRQERLRLKLLQAEAHEEASLARRATRFRLAIREQQRVVDLFPSTVYRTIVVEDRETGALQALGLVPRDCTEVGGIVIRGWSVQMLPSTWRLQRSQPGDIVAMGMIVSVDGEPLISEWQRRQFAQRHAEQKLSVRERRRLDRERSARQYHRFVAARRHREQRRQQEVLRADRERERLAREKQARQVKARLETMERRRAERVMSDEEYEAWAKLRDARRAPEAAPAPIAAAPSPAPVTVQPEPAVPTAETPAAPVYLPFEPPAGAPPAINYAALVGAFCVGSLLGWLLAPSFFSIFGLAAVGLAFTLGRATASRD